ncbi:hypothetical protein PoB_004370100 [Plakobranchus ocellatus]|uniref:Uncharacterized protein n=1 Tax=Plakobranchus ocellatus TaxID=259542 RepID=A0AAV4B9T4_9GAST|nr:hypothetical protein PoB_004370100 [Plakobranchus ocellatus]
MPPSRFNVRQEDDTGSDAQSDLNCVALIFCLYKCQATTGSLITKCRSPFPWTIVLRAALVVVELIRTERMTILKQARRRRKKCGFIVFAYNQTQQSDCQALRQAIALVAGLETFTATEKSL